MRARPNMRYSERQRATSCRNLPELLSRKILANAAVSLWHANRLTEDGYGHRLPSRKLTTAKFAFSVQWRSQRASISTFRPKQISSTPPTRAMFGRYPQDELIVTSSLDSASAEITEFVDGLPEICYERNVD